MSLIAEDKKNKVITGNILAFGAKASAHKSVDNDVINATVGMLNGEDGKFWVFDSVKKAQSQLSDCNTFAYPSTKGDKEYCQSIINWLFGDTISKFDGCFIDCVATPGGSGAIASTFDNCLDEGDKVLLPDYMWEAYIMFAHEQGHGYMTYHIYDEFGNFNIASVKESIDTLLKTQNRVLMVLNDPCQNPTGYCLKDDEYDKLIDLINSYDNKITLLMDTAYYDYYSTDGSIIRNRYSKLANLKKTNVVFSVSGSKSLGLYGLRIGAAVVVAKNESDFKDFLNAYEYTARAIWSCPSRIGLSLMTKCLSDENLKTEFYNELEQTSAMLLKRAEVFKEECKKYNLPLLPYEAGFFACIKAEKPEDLISKLQEKKVYGVPLGSAIRIALCSISLEEARRIPELISKCL